MWFLSWVADYPGRNDFLGVLLGTGSANNYGRWSSPDFDAAIDALPEHAYVDLLLLLTSDFVYQLMPDHRIVRHSCGPVAKPPATGDLCVVTYEQGKATVGGKAPAGSKAVRGRSRAA